MTLDLTKVRDHPAALLDKQYPVPAACLRLYEVVTGVTFAALDNDTLTAVRAAYEAGDIRELERNVVDLLGLDD